MMSKKQFNFCLDTIMDVAVSNGYKTLYKFINRNHYETE